VTIHRDGEERCLGGSDVDKIVSSDIGTTREESFKVVSSGYWAAT